MVEIIVFTVLVTMKRRRQYILVYTFMDDRHVFPTCSNRVDESNESTGHVYHLPVYRGTFFGYFLD